MRLRQPHLTTSRIPKAVAWNSPVAAFGVALERTKMKRTILRSLVVIFCLTTGIVTYGQVARTSTQPTSRTGVPASRSNVSDTPSYLIQPNDVLSVFVYKYPELSRDQVLVLPDGFISLPLIQDMKAAGM